MELAPEGRIATTYVWMKSIEQISQLVSLFQPEAVAFFDSRSTDRIVPLLGRVDVDAAVYCCRQCTFQPSFIKL